MAKPLSPEYTLAMALIDAYRVMETLPREQRKDLALELMEEYKQAMLDASEADMLLDFLLDPAMHQTFGMPLVNVPQDIRARAQAKGYAPFSRAEVWEIVHRSNEIDEEMALHH
jgi:hypothetical protein